MIYHSQYWLVRGNVFFLLKRPPTQRPSRPSLNLSPGQVWGGTYIERRPRLADRRYKYSANLPHGLFGLRPGALDPSLLELVEAADHPTSQSTGLGFRPEQAFVSGYARESTNGNDSPEPIRFVIHSSIQGLVTPLFVEGMRYLSMYIDLSM